MCRMTGTAAVIPPTLQGQRMKYARLEGGDSGTLIGRLEGILFERRLRRGVVLLRLVDHLDRHLVRAPGDCWRSRNENGKTQSHRSLEFALNEIPHRRPGTHESGNQEFPMVARKINSFSCRRECATQSYASCGRYAPLAGFLRCRNALSRRDQCAYCAR